MPLSRLSCLSAVAAISLASLASAQITQLRNDSAQIPLLPGATFSGAIQIGFGPAEEAMAIFTVPANTTFPIKILRVGVLWYSNGLALLGPGFGAPPSVQEGIRIISGNTPSPAAMSAVHFTDPIQFTDGGFNIVDLSAFNIIVTNPVTYLGAGLVFDNQLSSGDYTNQAPNGAPFAPSVVYDTTSAGGGSNANWIFSPTPTATATGMRSGWIRYRDLRTTFPGGSAPQGFDLVLRLFIEPYTPPAPNCVADLVGGDGNPPSDGSVDGNDFTAFLNAFAAGDILADLVGGDGNPPSDGSVDGNDFSAFLNGFGAGC